MRGGALTYSELLAETTPQGRKTECAILIRECMVELRTTACSQCRLLCQRCQIRTLANCH